MVIIVQCICMEHILIYHTIVLVFFFVLAPKTPTNSSCYTENNWNRKIGTNRISPKQERSLNLLNLDAFSLSLSFYLHTLFLSFILLLIRYVIIYDGKLFAIIPRTCVCSCTRRFMLWFHQNNDLFIRFVINSTVSWSASKYFSFDCAIHFYYYDLELWWIWNELKYAIFTFSLLSYFDSYFELLYVFTF